MECIAYKVLAFFKCLNWDNLLFINVYRSYTLNQHVQTVHEGLRFTCHTCGKTFSRKTTLDNHMTLHTSERPHKCPHPSCNQDFTTKSSLTDHLNLHPDHKPFPCTICHKSFNRKSYLKSHMNLHAGIRPFKCNYCKKAYTYKNMLQRHIATHAVVS